MRFDPANTAVSPFEAWLAAQTAVCWFLLSQVVFRLLGKTYDAAVAEEAHDRHDTREGGIGKTGNGKVGAELVNTSQAAGITTRPANIA